MYHGHVRHSYLIINLLILSRTCLLVSTVGDIKNLTFRSAKISYYEYRSMRTVT